MPQAIEIVSQSQKQGLTALCKQASAWGTAGQLAFGHGEDSFNQRKATVFMTRKGGTHLRSDTMNPPRLFPAFGGDDAQSMKLLTDKGGIAPGMKTGTTGPGDPVQKIDYTNTSGISISPRRQQVAKASTTSGSKSLPALLTIDSFASKGDMALRYGRSLIRES